MNSQLSDGTSRFFAGPATRSGTRAAWLAVTAVASLVVLGLVTNAFERRDAGAIHDVVHVIRLIGGLIFVSTGIGAFALSLRSVINGERSVVVWGALVVGFAVTALMIGEFTVLE